MFIPALGQTVAELSAEQKNAVSHRAQATAQLKALLRQTWFAG
jgi:XTP/dITP diphosphohydrolase